MMFGIDGLQSHRAHEMLDMLPADVDPVPVGKRVLDAARSVERILSVYCIDRVHDPDVLQRNHRNIVDARAGQAEQIGLRTDREGGMGLVNERDFFPSCQCGVIFF